MKQNEQDKWEEVSLKDEKKDKREEALATVGVIFLTAVLIILFI